MAFPTNRSIRGSESLRRTVLTASSTVVEKVLESKPNLTSEEELRLKIKQQEERIKYLEMENGLLKKLEEIKRRNRR